VLKPEPFLRAVDRITAERGQPSVVVTTTPQGRLFEDQEARWLSRLDHVTVLCGRYEGIDERVHQLLATHEISIGDYVLSGGEIPAMVILDAVARLLPGAVGDTKSVEQDSFAEGLLDHPHYTRPAAVRGLEVPEVLRSGHHQEIERWRRREALKRTLERRPDLLARASLNAEDRRVLEDLQGSD
jgi:tRNA (guanine37-N1)-methyltransferase